MRHDIHSPKNIQPVDYAFVGTFYQGASIEMHEAYEGDHRELADLLGDDWHERTYPEGNFHQLRSCDHCGSRFAHGVIYQHQSTGEYIAVGHICADSVLLPGTDEASRRRQLHERNAKRLATAEKNRVYRESFTEQHPIIVAAFDDSRFDGNYFVQDVARRFQGSTPELSEKQVEALYRTIKRQAEFDARKAREAEEHPPAPVVAGKGVVVTGEILSLKVKTSYYGDVLKMTVRDDRGFKVWGSVPSSIDTDTLIAGQRVTFTANVETSDRDEAFGFFNRPRKAEILQTTTTKEG